jgi:hypothetical protein
MAELRPGQRHAVQVLRREVVVPKARDALAFHRRIAVVSICIAMLAGSLDAILWHEARRQATEAAQVEVDIARERALIEDEYERSMLRFQLPPPRLLAPCEFDAPECVPTPSWELVFER